MSPPAEVLRIGEDRQLILDALQRQSLEALDSAFPYLGENTAPWSAAVTDVAPVLLTAQQTGVATSDGFLTESLAAQGARAPSDVKVRPAGFMDLSDGGGSWVKNLLYAPPSAYKQAIRDGLGTAVAAARARYIAQVATLDGIRDASRAADSLGMFGRRDVTGYVRALRGKTCSRCAILAGRVYKVEAFRRHLNCDCYGIPLARSTPAQKWKTSPTAYFNSLSSDEQTRIFGEAAALAIRESSDPSFTMSQVVNAEQGVYQVDAYGTQVSATRSGTTVRGTYGGYEIMPDGSFRRRSASELMRDSSVSKYRISRTPRLMPDQILALSEEFGWSREMTIQQFKRFGYIY